MGKLQQRVQELISIRLERTEDLQKEYIDLKKQLALMQYFGITEMQVKADEQKKAKECDNTELYRTSKKRYYRKKAGMQHSEFWNTDNLSFIK